MAKEEPRTPYFRRRWYHICFTYNHTDHKYHTYINGKLVYEMTYNVGRPIYGDYARLGQNEGLMQSYSGALSQVIQNSTCSYIFIPIPTFTSLTTPKRIIERRAMAL